MSGGMSLTYHFFISFIIIIIIIIIRNLYSVIMPLTKGFPGTKTGNGNKVSKYMNCIAPTGGKNEGAVFGNGRGKYNGGKIQGDRDEKRREAKGKEVGKQKQGIMENRKRRRK